MVFFHRERKWRKSTIFLMKTIPDLNVVLRRKDPTMLIRILIDSENTCKKHLESMTRDLVTSITVWGANAWKTPVSEVDYKFFPSVPPPHSSMITQCANDDVTVIIPAISHEHTIKMQHFMYLRYRLPSPPHNRYHMIYSTCLEGYYGHH